MLANFINLKAIKVNIGHDTRSKLYSKLFNLQYPIESRKKFPMTEFLCEYVGWIFGLEPRSEFLKMYNFYIPEESFSRAKKFLSKIHHKNKLLVNISGRRKWNLMHYKKFISIVNQKFPELALVFVAHPRDFQLLSKIIADENKSVFSFAEANSFYDVIALLQYMDLVFTPDTSIVHFANAFGVQAIIIYPKEGSFMDEWLPSNVKYIKFVSENKKDNNDIQPEIVAESIEFLLNKS